jgi:AcrR family transcriptional regulator
MTGFAATAKRPYRMNVRARRSEATAARIRSEALELFLTRAYDDVTLTEVAEAAGVTVPTLLAHFGRKGELFVAAGQERYEQITGARDEAPAGDHAAGVRNLIESYEADGDGVLHLLAEEDRFPAVREMTDRGRAYHRSWVRRVFAPSLESLSSAEAESLVVQLIVATDLFAWKLMRRDMKLSRRQTEAAILKMVNAMTGDD